MFKSKTNFMSDRTLTNWYTVKVQNNYEVKVSERIKLEMDRVNKDIKIVIPKERQVTAKKGKKHVKDKIIYPGYIFVETLNVLDLQQIIRATTGATNILSTKEDKKPIRLKVEEVRKMLLAEEELLNPVSEDLYVKGQSVKILTGIFENWVAVVDEIDAEHNKIKLSVSIFGKKTPHEVTFDDITKV